ncbi:MupA/Atu3671 family FMN-dependent luciferase-like monooxygenase [Actinoplanes derwentensis]|uniref:Natural product biosynthesis luciferase-like monooxygenase domain-containing protein n=1 Tax=Actinoplanes derwentensis TaxID=113562 RepID=A0A1H2DCR7_9ACTN|nr:MupA/Atu3671 family FMN-dependent luciferase-like monooxygenase [Actinoplanes derwentensis]GID89572.1 siderophore biosynthesis protein [Actinoplanes derwentensis]SDT80548.1 natural product biosynthesis luciferase-like monooxygenase domain-containing protein [Actinoplanes derwentensis]
MDFSLFYFADGDASSAQGYRLLLDGARFADANGLVAVWTPERHFHPFGGRYPNPAVTGAAVAAITERVQIRAGSVVGPLHHPARIVEDWSVVDNLSNGRVGISLASGWSPADFVLRPDAYADRGQRVLDAVTEISTIWRGGGFVGTDGKGAEVTTSVYPRPVQRTLPIWLTSAGRSETFKNAGRLGVGVLTHLIGQDLDRLAESIAAYRAARVRHGHAGRGHVALMLHTFLAADVDEARDIVRAPFSRYLRSNFSLVEKSFGRFASRQPTAADIEILIDRSFERYFQTAGLFGSIDDVRPMVNRLAQAGVDEVAALIDFGVDHQMVLDSLPLLAELQEASIKN